MTIHTYRPIRSAVIAVMTWIFLLQVTASSVGACALGSAVGDMRQTAARSGGTSCPKLTRFDISTPGSINEQWSTSLGTSPATILTADQSTAGRLNEVENVNRSGLGQGFPAAL